MLTRSRRIRTLLTRKQEAAKSRRDRVSRRVARRAAKQAVKAREGRGRGPRRGEERQLGRREEEERSSSSCTAGRSREGRGAARSRSWGGRER